MSTNPDVNQILENLGFYEIFDIHDTGETISATLRQLAVPEPCDKDALTRIIYEAHRALSELNPHNQEAFKGVLDSLRPKAGRDITDSPPNPSPPPPGEGGFSRR